MGFCAPLEQFNLLLQKGHFSELYQREREVERLTNSYHYRQASLQGHKQYLARGAVKAFEARLQKAEHSLFASVGRLRSAGTLGMDKLEDDCFSVKTLEFLPEEDQQDEEDALSGQEKSVLSNADLPLLGKRADPHKNPETASNHSRNEESRLAPVKASKAINVVNIKPSSPEWVLAFRGQEKERYKNPTVPWSYTLEDGKS